MQVQPEAESITRRMKTDWEDDQVNQCQKIQILAPSRGQHDSLQDKKICEALNATNQGAAPLAKNAGGLHLKVLCEAWRCW